MAKEKTYSEKLKDPRWQRRRLEILNRDEFTCQKCGDKENTLHVHHRWYKFGKEPWEYPDEILITLCHNCHEEEEWSKNDQRLIKNAFLISGFYNTELEQLASDIIYCIAEIGKDGFRMFVNEMAKKAKSKSEAWHDLPGKE